MPYIDDCIHPNSHGYRKMGDWWYDFTTQIPKSWSWAGDGANQLLAEPPEWLGSGRYRLRYPHQPYPAPTSKPIPAPPPSPHPICTPSFTNPTPNLSTAATRSMAVSQPL